MSAPTVFLLPGWNGSGPEHWQRRWAAAHGYHCLEQHDWARPLRGDWIARLEEALLDGDGPAVLAAHSLGCILVAAWAAHSRHGGRVKAALLVAPGDVEREDLRVRLPSWSPIERQRLPFPSVLLGSRDDPYCDFERARDLAGAWGARFVDCGALGHINADSGLGDWDAGHAILRSLLDAPGAP